MKPIYNQKKIINYLRDNGQRLYDINFETIQSINDISLSGHAYGKLNGDKYVLFSDGRYVNIKDGFKVVEFYKNYMVILNTKPILSIVDYDGNILHSHCRFFKNVFYTYNAPHFYEFYDYSLNKLFCGDLSNIDVTADNDIYFKNKLLVCKNGFNLICDKLLLDNSIRVKTNLYKIESI